MRIFLQLLTCVLGLALMLAACAAPRMSPPAHPESVLDPPAEIQAEDEERVDPEADVPIIRADVDDSDAVRDDGDDDDDNGDDGR